MGRLRHELHAVDLSVRSGLGSCRGEMRVPYETSLPTDKETQIQK